MIQLSLFPTRGYGLAGLPGLVEDWVTGEPLLVRSRRTAERQMKHVSFGEPRVVRLERHESPADEVPTYVISELKGQQR